MTTTCIVQGKVLICLTRNAKHEETDRRHMMPEVDIFLQTAQTVYRERETYRPGQQPLPANEFVHEDLDTWFRLYGDDMFLSRMPVGGKVRLWMQFEVTYTRDYWGEHDFDVEPTGKVRILRRQYPKKSYVSKAERNQLHRSAAWR